MRMHRWPYGPCFTYQTDQVALSITENLTAVLSNFVKVWCGAYFGSKNNVVTILSSQVIETFILPKENQSLEAVIFICSLDLKMHCITWNVGLVQEKWYK